MNIPLITPDWPAPPHVKAYVTTREGGVSKEPFASLNLATHVGDNPQTVIINRQWLVDALALPKEPVWLDQTHSNTVINADKVSLDDAVITPPMADAAFTQRMGTVCAALTADCLPILLCNQEGTVAGVIHAGWRGLANGIVQNMVNSLKDTPAASLMAWLGPAMGPKAYEVGLDVYKAFAGKNQLMQTAFSPLPNDKWLANLYELARLTLFQAGIKQVYGGEYCTYSDPSQFFSYRRANVTGRMATLIWLTAAS